MKVVAAALLAVVLSWMLVGSAAGQAAGVRVVVNGVEVPLPVPAVMFTFTDLGSMLGAIYSSIAYTRRRRFAAVRRLL